MNNPAISDKIGAIALPKQAARRQVKFRIPGLSIEEREVLTHSPLLDDLTHELPQKLLQMGKARSLNKGEFLFMAGDKVTEVYCLLSGKLNEYYASASGNTCLRCIQSPGSCGSLQMLFGSESHHSYYCEALKPSTIFSWDIGELRKLSQQEPALGLRVASVISGYFESSCRLNCVCRKPQASSRVAGYLLCRCEHMDQQATDFRTCRYGMQADIRPLRIAARDICLSRETFSKVLTALQKKNIIRMQNGIAEILDIEGLRKISD